MLTILIPADFDDHWLVEDVFWDYMGVDEAGTWAPCVSEQLQAMLWNFV